MLEIFLLLWTDRIDDTRLLESSSIAASSLSVHVFLYLEIKINLCFPLCFTCSRVVLIVYITSTVFRIKADNTVIDAERQIAYLVNRLYTPHCGYSTVSVFSLSYNFLNKIPSSPADFIVRTLYIIPITYKTCVHWLFKQ